MNPLEFWIIALSEYFVIFMLTFHMFSFRMRDYWFEIIVMSLILGFMSFSLRYLYDLSMFAPIVQMVLYAFLMWLVLRIHIYNAIIMSSVGVFFGLLQILLFVLFDRIGFVDNPMTVGDIQLIAVVSLILGIAISLILKGFRWRYTFIPSDDRYKAKNKASIYMVLVIVFLELSVIGFTYYFYLSGMNSFYVLLATISALLIILNLYFVNKQEMT